MAGQDYIVLRGRRSAMTFEPFAIPATRGYGTGVGPRIELDAAIAAASAEVKIDIMTLTPSEVREASAAPEVLGMTLPMPTKLIEPIGPDAKAEAAPSWGIAAVGADASPFTGAGVTVAVLDTGIKADHPAFAGMTLIQEDFSGSGNGDREGHGTHTAGTVFGRDVGGVRIGVARGVTHALIGKALDDTGRGSSEMLFRGMRWAADQGAQVISMSIGFDFPGLVKRLVDRGMPVEAATSQALVAYRGNLRMFDIIMAQIQAQAAFGSGSVVVAASGNESRRPAFEIAVSLPAAAQNVIAVGALEQQAGGGLGVARFSNTLPNLSAPGVQIVSAGLDDGTRPDSGTSMACPHVAGVAALWWEAITHMPVTRTADTVRNRMFAAARTDGFAQGVEIADRGDGIARAPGP